MTRLHAALCAVILLGLSGCISLFPKVTPAQLYRFEFDQRPPSTAAPAGPVFNVAQGSTHFPSAAQGDRILTVDGSQAAYIAAARWDAPAETLFDAAEAAAFDRAQGPARLLLPGDPANASVSLRLDVQAFEARYENGPKLAPTVVVRVRALLVNTLTRKVVDDQLFESRQAAADNRVGAIVEAFNAATTDVLGRVVEWTGREGAVAG